MVERVLMWVTRFRRTQSAPPRCLDSVLIRENYNGIACERIDTTLNGTTGG